jgi:hypothetical protein
VANEELVNRLAGELEPVSRWRAGRELLWLALLAAIELALFIAAGSMRGDMGTAMDHPSFWWKVISLGLLAVTGSVTAVASFDPMMSPRRRMTLVAATLGLALLAGWLVDALGTPGSAVMARLDWRHGLECDSWILALSIPPLIAFALLARRGAPVRLHASALLVGLASAAWGGFVFALRCPFDDPLYIAVWYAIAGAVITVIARLALPRIARW